MKALPVLLIALFLTGGCSNMKANPDFSQCSNRCTKQQDACMINAGTADQVARCGTGLDNCVEACEAKHPRWIER